MVAWPMNMHDEAAGDGAVLKERCVCANCGG